MLQSGRTLRLRAEAASLLDNFSYTARTRFPHPVAYRWRVMEALISRGASQDAYRSILDVAETLLCYAAHLAFVLARSAGADLSQQNELRKKLAKGRSGGGMGEWIAVLREVSQAKAVRSLPSTEPLAEFRVTFSASDVDQAIDRLFDRRNSNYHQRSIDDLDLPDEITDAKAELLTLMNGAAFLCDLPLVHVTSFRWDSLLKRSSLTYRELMGDHPVVAVRSRTYDQQGIEEGSLYVAEANGRLHLLRPFLIGQTCPKCRNWSTFHVDAIMRNNVTRLKCLERGHTMRQPTPTDALSAVGLL